MTTPRALALACLVAAMPAAPGTPAGAAPAPPTVGDLAADGDAALAVEDRIEVAAGGAWTLRRRVADAAGQVRYASRIAVRADGVDWIVEAGHPAQPVQVRITPGLVVARDPSGRERWRAIPDAPLCLPELMAELAVQADAAARSGAGLRCLVPIDKARKLAPLRIRRLADAADGSRRYAVGPGSFGMRLFFSRQELDVSADGRRVLAARGQFEVARSLDGRLRYLEGSLRWRGPRALRTLPDALAAPPPRP